MTAWDCDHERAELRTRRISGGGIQYRCQCLRCGGSVGNALPHAEIEKLSTPPPVWDTTLQERFDEGARAQGALLRVEREAMAEAWRTRYGVHLASMKWAQTRSKILTRDGICRGCMEKPPSEVHHLTYDHMGDELLFELVALCRSCHEKAHGAV